MASGDCSTCCFATFTPFLTWIWGLLIGAGLGLWHYFVLEAKESTEKSVQSLRVPDEQDYEEVKVVALVTTIILAAFTGFAMLMSIVRTRIALGARSRTFPRGLSTVYMVFMYPILSVLCLCLVWLVLLLIAVTVWMAVMAVYDQGGKYWLESNFNQQWETLQEEGEGMEQLVESWDGVRSEASQLVSTAIGPGIESVRRALDSGDRKCPQFCINLAEFGGLFNEGDPESCLCEFSRIDHGRVHAKRAWMEELPYVLLGVGLTWIGMTLLVIEISAHLAATRSERSASSMLRAIAKNDAENGNWNLANTIKGGALGESTAYDFGNGAQFTPVEPLGWVAGTNSDCKQQQNLRSTTTAADADTREEGFFEQERQQREHRGVLYTNRAP